MNRSRISKYFRDLFHSFKIVLLDKMSKFSTFAYTAYPVGVVIGKLPIVKKYVCSLPDSESHILIAAPSGSGKTVGPVIMTLRSLRDRFNAFVMDVSGDIHTNIPGNKLIFSPFSECRSKIKWNVFAKVDAIEGYKREERRNLELRRMTQLIYHEYQPSSAAEYYGDGGLTILQAAMIAGYNAGLDFVDICDQVYRSTIDELFGKIELCPYANDLVAEYKEAPDRKKFKQNLNKAVDIFANDPFVAESFGRGPDSISPYTLEETSIYVCLPDVQLEYCKQLLHVISAQVVDYMLSREFNVASHRQPKILLCLDEMTSLGHLGSLCGLLQRSRKHGVRIMILTQDFSDLEMVYPNEHRSMLSNLPVKVVLGGIHELESMNYISDLIGSDPEDKRKKFFYPEDIRMLSHNKEIVVFGGGHIVINKARWFEEFDEDEIVLSSSSGSRSSYDDFL